MTQSLANEFSRLLSHHRVHTTARRLLPERHYLPRPDSTLLCW